MGGGDFLQGYDDEGNEVSKLGEGWESNHGKYKNKLRYVRKVWEHKEENAEVRLNVMNGEILVSLWWGDDESEIKHNVVGDKVFQDGSEMYKIKQGIEKCRTLTEIYEEKKSDS